MEPEDVEMSDDERHIRFNDTSCKLERNRVLTMKYPKQQMSVIRKRVQLENWMDAEITKLFNGNEDNNVPVELEFLSGMPSSTDRRRYMNSLLDKARCPASPDAVSRFLDQLECRISEL